MVLVHVHRFPNKQNHTRAIYPNDIKRPMRNPPNDINRSTRNPSKRNRRGGACVPARTSAQRRFHAKNTRIVCRDFNNGCAPVGRHGRAHRHRPYQSPSYFSTQSYTNKIIIYAQSIQTTSTVCAQSAQTKCVGAVPVCPPERSRSGVSIPRIHALCAGDE